LLQGAQQIRELPKSRDFASYLVHEAAVAVSTQSVIDGDAHHDFTSSIEGNAQHRDNPTSPFETMPRSKI
jgi:hypothetical protein